MKYTKEQVAESRNAILDALENSNSEIWAQVNSVSKSGMSRKISLYVIYTDNYGKGALHNLTYHAARVLGLPRDDSGMKINGCGMDMIFHAIDCLERALGIDAGKYSQTYRRF